MSNGRRGAGEEGECAENAGDDRRRQRLQRRHDCNRRRRGRGALIHLDGYMSGGAEGAVGVSVGPVGVGMGNLSCAGDDHQKDAEDREEVSPRAANALPLKSLAHTRPTI